MYTYMSVCVGCVCACVRIHIVFLFKQLSIVTRSLQALFSQCLIVPGQLQAKAVVDQGMQEDEVSLVLWARVFYPWICLSIMMIKSRPTLRPLTIVLKFLMDNASPHCLTPGPPNLHQSSMARNSKLQPSAQSRAQWLESIMASGAQAWKWSLKRSSLWYYIHSPLWWSTVASWRFCSHPAAPPPHVTPYPSTSPSCLLIYKFAKYTPSPWSFACNLLPPNFHMFSPYFLRCHILRPPISFTCHYPIPLYYSTHLSFWHLALNLALDYSFIWF